MRAVPALAAAVASVLLLAACAPQVIQPPATTATLQPSDARALAPSPPPDPRPDIIWPLSGVEAADVSADDLNRPAIAVKIENTSAARPQTNLEHADVVYEEYVEYGISRLIAVYHSDFPDTVGPIRSLRPMDKNIVGSYEGPLVFSGAQSRFIDDAARSGQKLLAQDTGASGFFRVNTKPAPHNLHGRMADFLAQSGGLTAPDPQWAFAFPAEFATAQVEGKEAARVNINMSSQAQPRWRWDAGKSLWMRSERDSPHKTVSGTQLSATNLIMLWVDVKYTSGSARGSVPETLIIGDGKKGFVASGNKFIEITWSKASRTAPVEMTTLDGDPLELMPGQTWVTLVPESGVGHSTGITFD
jgi:hypothetical protein